MYFMTDVVDEASFLRTNSINCSGLEFLLQFVSVTKFSIVCDHYMDGSELKIKVAYSVLFRLRQ